MVGILAKAASLPPSSVARQISPSQHLILHLQSLSCRPDLSLKRQYDLYDYGSNLQIRNGALRWSTTCSSQFILHQSMKTQLEKNRIFWKSHEPRQQQQSQLSISLFKSLVHVFLNQ